MKNLNPDSVSDEDVQKVAKAMGINLDDNGSGKTEEELNSEKKTGTESGEGNRTGELEKNEERLKRLEEQVAGSTKEFQTKYKPMEESIKKLEQLSGKNFDELIVEFEKGQIKAEKKDDDKNKKDTPVDKKDEVVSEILSYVKKELEPLKEEISNYKDKEKLSAKKKVETFLDKFSVSKEDYGTKIAPLLSGIKEMRKPSGDPYTLEEGLEIAYTIANKDNIDKIVEQKSKIKQKEIELSFSPGGSKGSTPMTSKPQFSEQQKLVAQKMGVSLEKESKK